YRDVSIGRRLRRLQLIHQTCELQPAARSNAGPRASAGGKQHTYQRMVYAVRRQSPDSTVSLCLRKVIFDFGIRLRLPSRRTLSCQVGQEQAAARVSPPRAAAAFASGMITEPARHGEVAKRVAREVLPLPGLGATGPRARKAAFPPD